MNAHRLLAAVATVTMPVVLFTWVELVSVEQPQRIQPGATFSATVDAVGRQWPHILPSDAGTAPITTDGNAWIRLGVLIPDDWNAGSVTYQLDGQATAPLDPALAEETARYEDLHPAPPGYTWRAFGSPREVVTEGASIRFHVQITTSERSGTFTVGYMTWQGVWTTMTAAEGPEAAQDAGTAIGPMPSYLEADITVAGGGPAPKVTAFNPPNAAADVPVDTTIRVTFDREMEVQSLRQGGLQLHVGQVWWPDYRGEVPIRVFYNPATRTAVVDPVDDLLGGTVYSVVVTREARAVDGVPVEVPVSADFLTAPAPWVPLFIDVPYDHLFREAIETLARVGIADGYADGTYRPYSRLTRADLAIMLVRLLGVHTPEPGPRPVYVDIAEIPDETVDFIGEATRAGIVEGFLDGTFRPGDTVTRIQLVRMVVRTAEYWLSAPPPGFDAGFTDVLAADLPYVNWAYYNGLVLGKSPGRFDPWSIATRGHGARVLYGLYLTMPQPVPLGG